MTILEAWFELIQEYIFVDIDIQIVKYIAIFITAVFFISLISSLLSLLRLGGKK